VYLGMSAAQVLVVRAVVGQAVQERIIPVGVVT
jgi:hypothetical protein